MYATSTIPLFLGNKKFFTTLTQEIGVTTKTEYETATQTVQAANGLLGGLNLPNQLNAAPGFTITSEPVTKETMIPSTVTKEIRITFRYCFPLHFNFIWKVKLCRKIIESLSYCL